MGRVRMSCIESAFSEMFIEYLSKTGSFMKDEGSFLVFWQPWDHKTGERNFTLEWSRRVMRVFAAACDVPFSLSLFCESPGRKPQRRRLLTAYIGKQELILIWSFSLHEHQNLQCSVKLSDLKKKKTLRCLERGILSFHSP